MKRRGRLWCAAVLLTSSLAGCVHPPGGGAPALRLMAASPGDSAQIMQGKGIVRIEIRSERGIGWVEFAFAKGPPDGALVVKLPLRGLEQFRLTVGPCEQTVSWPSHGGVAEQQTLRCGLEQERNVIPGDPRWMQVKTIAPSGDSTIPLKDGWFEVSVPLAALPIEGGTFRLDWVDFFR